MHTSANIKLSMLGLPVMATLEDFSKLTHVSAYSIYRLSTYSEKYYLTYEIPKHGGKFRTISQPSKKLKGLQSWILVNILNKLKVSESCKGFEKSTSIVDNVLPHKDYSTILALDIKDFFPTIKSHKIFNIFKAIGYNNTIATILTNLCVYKDGLPQGGPCSPKLANLSVWKLDIRIQGFVGKQGINYTRYADDLTFSGNNPSKVIKILRLIKLIIEDEGLALNKSKTRISGPSRRREVTGLIISGNRFGIGQHKYKLLRSKIHNLTKETEQHNLKRAKEVQGWLSYIKHVDKARFNDAVKYIRKLQNSFPKTLINKILIPPIAVLSTTETIVIK